MQYQMKAGVLYQGDQVPCAKIKGRMCGPEKLVLTPEGEPLLRTEIRELDPPRAHAGDVRGRQYVMYSPEDSEYATACPGYAPGEPPREDTWPVFRMPQTDHAMLRYAGGEYRLDMINAQRYALLDGAGKQIASVLHRGLTGGWRILAPEYFSPAFLCGLFIFCRYLEQENVLPLV